MATVALDTNLLLLFVVGSTSRDYIAKHKRLDKFTEADFDLLLGILARVERVLVTPHILTETSNWIDHIGEPARTHVRMFLKRLVGTAHEHAAPSLEIMEHPNFLRLGLADAAILSLPRVDSVAWTTDLHLYLAGQQQGANIQNFNHLREARGTV